MDCPRCRLSLAAAEYEGQEVHFCGTCWGYWLTRSQLDQITRGATYRFGKGEAQAIGETLDSDGDANRQGSERDAVSCPVCGAQMKRKKYTADCPVQIDECDQHGLWLDTGEIKDLQVFIERTMK
jgi:Zn-finger nucleic acid-binding protein